MAVVPGAEVPIFSLDLPPGLRGQAREQVARRQLQDRAGLTAETTQIRPVYMPRQSDRWSKVLIADSALLAEWKAAAGPQCRAVLPDYLTLPTANGIWTVAGQDGYHVVRLAPDEGFAAQPDIALAMLERELDGQSAPPGAMLVLGPVPEGLEELAGKHEVPIIAEAAEAKALGLEEPTILGHGELDFDLRRDPQLARARLRRQVLPWRWPVLFAAIAAALWSAAQIIETGRIEARTDQLNALTQNLVRENFIPTGPLLDVRVQVSQVMAARQAQASADGDESSAMDLFAIAAGVLSAQGVQTDQASTVSASEVALDLTLPDFASVDRLAADLRAAGLDVEIVESRVSDGSSAVRSEIRLRAPDREAAE
nr:type II secretion system protein GspL [Sulfitobacter alexandrii]